MQKVSLFMLNLAVVLLVSAGSARAMVHKGDRDSIKPTEFLPAAPVGDSLKDTSHSTLPPTNFVLNPIIGAAMGITSYFGNVKAVNSYAQNPATGRFAYTLTFAQKLSEHFEFNLYGLYGYLGEYVRTDNYNWNFQSLITGAGVQLMYKILPQKDISPFFTLGVESFSFISKTNMKDQYGNTYYYWTDGSIRSQPQNSPDASNAVILTPDYIYETDIRSLDLDGSGNYSEQSYAIPIGAGFMIHITKKADITLGTTFHYTFTDHIDGLTPEVPGTLKGTHTHDKYFLTAIGFRYDLTKAENYNKNAMEDRRYDNVTLDASLIQDTVHPVANADTAKLSDSAIHRQYLMYSDNTGKYEKIIYDSSGVIKYAATTNVGSGYTVEVGKYAKGVPAGDMDKMLSVPDVKSTLLQDSSTIYTAGDYTDVDAAKKRQEELAKQGFKDTKIVLRKGTDFIELGEKTPRVSKPDMADTSKTNTEKVATTQKAGTETMPSEQGVVYRVQLGAFSHKLSNTSIFHGVKNLVEIKTDNGLYTYSAGAFSDYKEAESYKAEMRAKGFPDAFIRAYKDGKRVPLSESGATYVKPEKENIKENIIDTTASKTHISGDKKDITFRVQIGAYKNTPPRQMRNKYKKFKNLAFDESESGITRYYLGPFTSYEDAKAMKEKAIAVGINDTFVVAYLKDKVIPIKEALNIFK